MNKKFKEIHINNPMLDLEIDDYVATESIIYENQPTYEYDEMDEVDEFIAETERLTLMGL